MENAGKGEVRGSVPARRTRDHQNMRSTARASLFMIMCPQSRSAALAGKGMAFAAAKKAFSSVGRNGGGGIRGQVSEPRKEGADLECPTLAIAREHQGYFTTRCM